MADGIAGVGVEDELGERRGAGGEVEQKGIVRERGSVRYKRRVGRVRTVERRPPGGAATDDGAGVVALDGRELGRAIAIGDDVPGAAAHEAIAEVVGREQRR